VEALLKRARAEPLDEEGYRKLEDLLRALSSVVDMIGRKDTTIGRLRALRMITEQGKQRKGFSSRAGCSS
jgi:hypothetical protein